MIETEVKRKATRERGSEWVQEQPVQHSYGKKEDTSTSNTSNIKKTRMKAEGKNKKLKFLAF